MTQFIQTRRERIANAIANEVYKNPDAASNFICTVADEVSMVEFERIYFLFLNSLRTNYKTTNMQN